MASHRGHGCGSGKGPFRLGKRDTLAKQTSVCVLHVNSISSDRQVLKNRIARKLFAVDSVLIIRGAARGIDGDGTGTVTITIDICGLESGRKYRCYRYRVIERLARIIHPAARKCGRDRDGGRRVRAACILGRERWDTTRGLCHQHTDGTTTRGQPIVSHSRLGTEICGGHHSSMAHQNVGRLDCLVTRRDVEGDTAEVGVRIHKIRGAQRHHRGTDTGSCGRGHRSILIGLREVIVHVVQSAAGRGHVTVHAVLLAVIFRRVVRTHNRHRDINRRNLQPAIRHAERHVIVRVRRAKVVSRQAHHVFAFIIGLHIRALGLCRGRTADLAPRQRRAARDADVVARDALLAAVVCLRVVVTRHRHRQRSLVDLQ